MDTRFFTNVRCIIIGAICGIVFLFILWGIGTPLSGEEKNIIGQIGYITFRPFIWIVQILQNCGISISEDRYMPVVVLGMFLYCMIFGAVIALLINFFLHWFKGHFKKVNHR